MSGFHFVFGWVFIYYFFGWVFAWLEKMEEQKLVFDGFYVFLCGYEMQTFDFFHC